MEKTLKQIYGVGIVPVIKIDDVEKAVPLARALVAGGIPLAEVTFRTAEGEEAIRKMSSEVPEILVGAGTVTTTDQVDRAIAAGAKFLVSPGLNPKIVSYAQEKGILITPGCANPSDVEVALELGLSTVKFFPAEQAGGLAYIKAMSAPYTTMRFMPTGGIGVHNLNSYLAFDKIVACGGSWMVPANLVNEGKFDEITRLCKDAVKTMLGIKLAHVGINADNPAEASSVSKMFGALLGLDLIEGNSSIFAADSIEVMKTPYLGTKGHIGFATLQADRAFFHLSTRGIEFNLDSAKYDDKGRLKSIYFKEEIAGFALHLVQKSEV